MNKENWEKVRHKDPIDSKEAKHKHRDHKQRGFYSLKAFENRDGILITMNQRMYEKPNGNPFYDTWVDVVDKCNDEVLYSSILADVWALDNRIEKMMDLIDGISQY